MISSAVLVLPHKAVETRIAGLFRGAEDLALSPLSVPRILLSSDSCGCLVEPDRVKPSAAINWVSARSHDLARYGISALKREVHATAAEHPVILRLPTACSFPVKIIAADEN